MIPYGGSVRFFNMTIKITEISIFLSTYGYPKFILMMIDNLKLLYGIPLASRHKFMDQDELFLS